MKLRGPIITLAVGAVFAAVLLVVDLRATASHTTAAPVPAPVASTTTRPAASPTPTPTSIPAIASPPNGTYAGPVDGNSGASIAIAVKNGRAIAYVCDGKKAEAWLQGPVAGGVVDAAGAASSHLSANYTHQRLAGTVTAAGHTWTFTVGAVVPPSGLYRASATVRQAKVVAGWIVLPDGRQVGVINNGGTEAAAPPLDPTTLTTVVDSTTVTATPVDGSPIELGSGE
jgi:serine/threonine-protein kinase